LLRLTSHDAVRQVPEQIGMLAEEPFVQLPRDTDELADLLVRVPGHAELLDTVEIDKHRCPRNPILGVRTAGVREGHDGGAGHDVPLRFELPLQLGRQPGEGRGVDDSAHAFPSWLSQPGIGAASAGGIGRYRIPSSVSSARKYVSGPSRSWTSSAIAGGTAT